MHSVLRFCDDTPIIIGADFFFELLHISGPFWAWRSESDTWWLIPAGQT